MGIFGEMAVDLHLSDIQEVGDSEIQPGVCVHSSDFDTC